MIPDGQDSASSFFCYRTQSERAPFPKQLTENLDDRNFYRYLIVSAVCAFTDIFQDIQQINVENVQMRERER